MIEIYSLVIYRNKPALIKEKKDEKYSITLHDGSQVKVRDKDIELLHSGPIKDSRELKTLLAAADNLVASRSQAIHEAWELLSDESAGLTIKELSAFVFGEYTSSSALAVYSLLRDGLYFYGTDGAIFPRSRDEVTAENTKRSDKQRETDERAQFLNKIKSCLKNPAACSFLHEDVRFIQDVQALAYGKSAKSRTMKELGLSETPEDAHTLLLKTGIWTNRINPHPSRFGLSLNSASVCPDMLSISESEAERRDLCHLAAFAVDSPWSNDPDDAVSVETDESGNYILYVHVADPASVIMPGSPAETEARNRGVTLYLPEREVRMLAEETLPLFALGLSDKSFALTFKISLDKNSVIVNTEIFPSIIKAKRLTYEQADSFITVKGETDAARADTCALRTLHEFAVRNYKRRSAQGAINIELPEVHISIQNEEPKIEPVVHYRSAFMVRECMIIAGEGAGNWAAGNGLAFPYISQEVEMQGKLPDGMAGSFALRRCSRPRVLSAKPGRHQGLGLDIYTQVTSPLRRYTDLLAHMQIRAFLQGRKPLSADEISERLGYSEAAASAAVQAERASNTHWTMVYLENKKDSVLEAIALEKKGNRMSLVIPSLALETQAALQKDVSPNETVMLALKSVNIPRLEAVFTQTAG